MVEPAGLRQCSFQPTALDRTGSSRVSRDFPEGNKLVWTRAMGKLDGKTGEIDYILGRTAYLYVDPATTDDAGQIAIDMALSLGIEPDENGALTDPRQSVAVVGKDGSKKAYYVYAITLPQQYQMESDLPRMECK